MNLFEETKDVEVYVDQTDDIFSYIENLKDQIILYVEGMTEDKVTLNKGSYSLITKNLTVRFTVQKNTIIISGFSKDFRGKEIIKINVDLEELLASEGNTGETLTFRLLDKVGDLIIAYSNNQK